jgi:hypothetical protein
MCSLPTRPRLSAILLSLAILYGASADDPPAYRVQKVAVPVQVDGKRDEAAWKNAKSVGDFQFPWWKEGKKEQTEAKLLWNDQFLYVLYNCEDAHVYGEQTERDSPVYQDDCVEVFTAPDPQQPNNYFNIEMNVRAAFLDQHHPGGPGTQAQPNWNATGIVIVASVEGTLNDDSDIDRGWVLEAAIPFENFRMVARNTPPKSDDVWHLNLNRLGGKTNPQHSQWSPGKSERPAFHAPQYFGRVIFVQ